MHIPSPEEFRFVLSAADARARAALAIIALSGQRLQVLGNYDGSDGLVLGDLLDFDIKTMTWRQKPAMIRIRESLSKVGFEFFTFAGEEACEYLLKYFLTRLEHGEALDSDSPVIVPRQPDHAAAMRILEQAKAAGRHLGKDERKAVLQDAGLRANVRKKNPFVCTPKISMLIKKPMKAVGMANNPAYVFRSYFQSHALEAHDVPRDWLEFWVGHKGEVSAEYTVHKRLAPETVAEMRQAFLRVLPRVETLERKFNQLGTLDGQLRQEIEKNIELRSIERQIAREDAVSQRVVEESELPQLFEDGWTFVAVLPSGKVVVKT